MNKKSIEPQRGFFPQPVYLIGTYKDNNEANFALVTWVTFASVNPPQLMISLRGNKKTKESIMLRKEFTAHLVNESLLDFADFSAMHSGRDIDKCKVYNIIQTKAKTVNAPLLEDSPWIFECRVNKVIDNNDVSVIIADILNIQIDESIKDYSYGNIDLEMVNPIIYAPGYYYKIGSKKHKVGFIKK